MYRQVSGYSNHLIDPTNITKFNCTTPELELVLLFWVCAAGKKADLVSKRLDRFLTAMQLFGMRGQEAPFETIRNGSLAIANSNYDLADILKHCGIGCYNNKARTFRELAYSGLNLKTCSAEDLEQIFGIGMKTSRCFLLHSRRNARHAGLDTHLLKHLRESGHAVPKSTPASSKQYTRLEEIVLDMADQAGMSPAEFDLNIWKKYSRSV